MIAITVEVTTVSWAGGVGSGEGGIFQPQPLWALGKKRKILLKSSCKKTKSNKNVPDNLTINLILKF